jgi:hypothetical protein
MSTEKEPLGYLFESIAYESPTNVEELIDTMSVEQSYYIITEAIHMAYSKKIFSLQESEILSKALRTIKSSTFEK